MKKLLKHVGVAIPHFEKLLLIMRLSILLILAAVFSTSASVYSQVTKLTLKMEKVQISDVFDAIEEQSEFVFFYNRDFFNDKRIISVDFENMKIDDVLSELFKDQTIDYEIYDRNILMKIPESTAVISESGMQQQRVVSGKVTDFGGLPLPGVTIVVKGTTQGTITDAEGTYSLSGLSESSVLVFSFVGMRSQEITVGNQASINISLEEDVIGLEEVVAIGYGTMERSRITSSIATVSEDKFLKGPITQSPLQLLSGKVAGLGISRSRGGDPTSSVQIQLRGLSSVRGSTSPLVIIDGIPGGDLNSIAPENIKSMDLLRDGSAAAIYGTRANAGVIIITTKQGSPGKPSVEYSSYAFTERYFKKPRVLTSDEWRHYKSEFENSSDLFLKEKGQAMLDYGFDTDWFDVVSQEAISQVHDISISGGTESTQYYGSINYRDINGLIKRTGENVITERLSLTHHQLDNRLIIQLNASNALIVNHAHNDEIYTQVITKNPTIPVYNSQITDPDMYGYNPAGKFFEEIGYNNPNPLGLIEQFERDNQGTRFIGNAKVSYEILDGLKATVMGAFQRYTYIYGYYESRDSWSSWTATQYNGVATRTANKGDDRTIETTLNYNKLINDDHNITALAGYSYQDFVSESMSASNRYFLSDAFTYNNLGAGLHISRGNYSDPVSSSKSSSKLIAFFGRVNYSFKEKYLLSASLRREGSTKFGKDNKWGYFPAISAGWTVSDEPFMEGLGFIDNLKLRVGYGVTGNQGIDNYLSLSRVTTSGVMLYNGAWNPGFAPASNPNPNLRWERKAETDIGLDVSMFNNINVNIDLYKRSTTDLLYQYSVPVPPNLYGTTWANVGEISNKGIELTFSATPISNPKLSWYTSFNISYNKNMLESLSNEDYSHSYLMIAMPNAGRLGQSDETIYRVEEGQPLGNIYGWEHAGISEDGKWQVWNKDNTEKIHPTNATFEDRRVIGNGLPKSYFGFNNTLRYGNFDLDMTLRGALFFDILNTIMLHRLNPATLPAQTLLNTFTDPEIFALRDQRNYMDSYWVQRGDYVKLDNITLGYNIPVSNLNLKYFKQIRFYVSGANLFCLTKYTGEDPELEIQGLSPGYDQYWNYPRTKTYTIGLNVKF